MDPYSIHSYSINRDSKCSFERGKACNNFFIYSIDGKKYCKQHTCVIYRERSRINYFNLSNLNDFNDCNDCCRPALYKMDDYYFCNRHFSTYFNKKFSTILSKPINICKEAYDKRHNKISQYKPRVLSKDEILSKKFYKENDFFLSNMCMALINK